MKLTWFGGTTLRLHIGGQMIVMDPAAVGGTDPAELVSGADRVFMLRDRLPDLDAGRWQPRRLPPLIDDEAISAAELFGLGPGVVLVDAMGEPPLIVAAAGPERGARWSRDAIVVALGAEAADVAVAALEKLAPRLIAVAGDEAVIAAALDRMRDRLGGTGFMALEPGLALEI